LAGPAGPTLNELLDRWLAHLHNTGAIRLRTIGRYRQLLEHHVRPYLGQRAISSLGTLHVQELYEQLARGGRKDGKRGGLHPRTIRQIHHCLHQALRYGVKWHGLASNAAARESVHPAVRDGNDGNGALYVGKLSDHRCRSSPASVGRLRRQAGGRGRRRRGQRMG